MPRYHFDIYDDSLYRDVDGIELPNISEVKIMAERKLANHMRVQALSLRDNGVIEVLVRDDEGRTVLTLRLNLE